MILLTLAIGFGFTVFLLMSAWIHRDMLKSAVQAIGYKSKDVRPVLWWYVDDVESNARQWLDFGNRDSREPNEPYLEICWDRANKLWGREFQLTRIVGRKQLLKSLNTKSFSWPTVNTCPPSLWMAWSRASLLSEFGGLWMDGSVLPFSTEENTLLARVEPHAALAFGTDSDSRQGGEPGSSAGWARAAGDSTWTAQANMLTSQINAGPETWTAFLANGGIRRMWSDTNIQIDRSAEISRDKFGRRLELETLLTESVWNDGTEANGLWVPWPRGRDELTRASTYGWFLRSSAAQIFDGNYLWAQWAQA